MTMPVIMDIAVVVVVVGFTLLGAYRGLVKTLAGLAITIVALFGAGMIAASFADPVTKMVAPVVEEKLSAQLEIWMEEGLGEQVESLIENLDLPIAELGEKVEELLETNRIKPEDLGEPLKSMLESGQIQISQLGETLTELFESGQIQAADVREKLETVLANNPIELPELQLDISVVEEALNQLGLEEEFRTNLLAKIEEIVAESGAPLVTAVVQAVVRAVVFGILYILAFLVLVVLLHILVAAMDLVMKLPVLKSLNRLGGAVIGLAEGALLVFLAVWIARKMGVSFEMEALAEAHILHLFTNNTPLTILSFLK